MGEGTALSLEISLYPIQISVNSLFLKLSDWSELGPTWNKYLVCNPRWPCLQVVSFPGKETGAQKLREGQ